MFLLTRLSERQQLLRPDNTERTEDGPQLQGQRPHAELHSYSWFLSDPRPAAADREDTTVTV